jgi:hypothetical protein
MRNWQFRNFIVFLLFTFKMRFSRFTVMFLLDIKKTSFDWAFIYWGSPRFWIFEKIKKSEALLLGNVTLHCQRATEEATLWLRLTTVNRQRRGLRRQRSTVNGQRTAIRSDAVDDDNGKAALTTVNRRRTTVNGV